MTTPGPPGDVLARFIARRQGQVRVPPQYTPQWRQAVITGVATSTVTIKLGGSDTEISGVRRLASYTPQVGDVCWVIVNGPDITVHGKLA